MFPMDFNHSDVPLRHYETGCLFIPMPYLESKFYLVSIFGSLLAAVAIMGNSLLLYVFATRPYFRRTYFLYFIALAVMDLIVSICYIFVIALSIVFEFTENMWLMDAWYSYVIPMNTLSNVAMLCSHYFLIAASLERYLPSPCFPFGCTIWRRMVTISGIVIFATISKGTVYFELQVVHNVNCTGLASKLIEPTPLRENRTYEAVWCFWYRNIIEVFLPFILLLGFNFRTGITDIGNCRPCCNDQRPQSPHTVRNDRLLRLTHHLEKRPSALIAQRRLLGKNNVAVLSWAQRARARVRKASARTLAAIVLEYLTCNSLSFVVTAWEHIDPYSLTHNRKTFYLFATDVISLLVVAASAIRLPTYLVADVTFRREMRWILTCKKPKKKRTEQPARNGFSAVVLAAMEQRRRVDMTEDASSLSGEEVMI